MIPPDFTTFRNQAIQQGFSPRSSPSPRRSCSRNRSRRWARPGTTCRPKCGGRRRIPFTSSLTGQSAGDLAADFTAKTSRPWTQPIGFIHSLFEVATNVMGRVTDVTDAEGVAAAIAATNMDTMVGKVAWDGAGLPPFAAANVCKTPLVGGQWRRKDDGTFALVVVDNQTAPNIPTGGMMEALAYMQSPALRLRGRGIFRQGRR